MLVLVLLCAKCLCFWWKMWCSALQCLSGCGQMCANCCGVTRGLAKVSVQHGATFQDPTCPRHLRPSERRYSKTHSGEKSNSDQRVGEGVGPTSTSCDTTFQEPACRQEQELYVHAKYSLPEILEQFFLHDHLHSAGALTLHISLVSSLISHSICRVLIVL